MPLKHMFASMKSRKGKLTSKKPKISDSAGVDPAIPDLDNTSTEQPEPTVQPEPTEQPEFTEQPELGQSMSRQLKHLSVYNPIRHEAVLVAQKQEAAIRERVQGSVEEFPQYRFLELIGKGTYGRVYKW